MGVQVRETYPGSLYLRITYRNIRKTKAIGSKGIYSHWVPGTRRVTTSILDTNPAIMPEIRRLIAGVISRNAN